MLGLKKRFRENQFFIQILTVVTSTIIITVTITILIFISITERNVIENFKDSHQLIINEVMMNYTDIFEESVTLLDTFNNQNTLKNYLYSKNASSIESANITYNMTRMMKDVDAKLKNVGGNLFIVFEDGIYYGFDDGRKEPKETILNQAFLEDKETKLLLYDIVDKGFTQLSNDRAQFLMHRNLFDDKGLYYGHVVLSIPLDDLDNIYHRLIKSDTEMVYFLDEDNNVVHSQNDIPFDIDMLSDHNYIYTEDKTPIPGIRLISLINKSNLKNEVYRINTLILSIIVLIAIVALILYKFVRKLTHPIYSLAHSLDTVDLAKIDKHSVGGTYEIQQLTDSYNRMLDQVNHYINNLLELEEKKLQSDLTALLRQIRPHFIYNTLTSIRFLITTNQNEKAEESLEDFIVMLQELTHFDQGFKTLADEKTLLEHYGRLSKLRFGPSMTLSINLPESLYDYQIPQLMLQPLVENAFFHAFSSSGGFITISFIDHVDYLMIEIMDNGKGMSSEQVDAIMEQMQEDHPSTHIGISNVHQRIVREFGPEYGLSIYSEINKGTIISVKIPILFNRP